MAVDVKVPAVGESVQEAMIHKWHKSSGESVRRDDVLMELETDKATVEVTAEADGVIEILAKEGATVAIGAVVARIDTSAKAAAAAPQAKAAAPVPPPPPGPGAKVPEAATPEAPLSPAVRRLVTEEKIDPSTVAASGKGGRLTKGDVLAHMESSSAAPQTKSPAGKPAEAKAPDV